MCTHKNGGGAVRQPCCLSEIWWSGESSRNADDKCIKRKRGGRSAAAVAARIERGYLKRIRTAGSTACVNNHVDSRRTGTDGRSHKAAEQETAVTILTSERESLARQVQSLTGTPGQCVRTGVVDSRVIGKPDQFDGDPMKYADWLFKLRSYFGAVDQRCQQELTRPEAPSTPRLKCSQHTNVLHSGDDNCRSRVREVSQRRRERSS